MKKNRRILPILLCAAMAVSVMTGCKAKTEESAKAAEGAKTGQSEGIPGLWNRIHRRRTGR